MSILQPQIIVPDSSHWAKWIDSALDKSRADHPVAIDFHDRLMAAGRIPLMSWHHLEELLAIDDEAWASRRVGFIKALPFIAYVRFPAHAPHCGSIIDVIAAEVTAVLDGATCLRTVRDNAKKLLIQTGTGEQVIGQEAWVWDVVRQAFLERSQDAKMIAATRQMRLFDDRRTVGKIAKGSIRSVTDQATRISKMYTEVENHIRERGDREIANPNKMADDFMSLVKELELPQGIDVRTFLEIALVSQGLDRAEIKDDSVLADLNDLALFRARLKLIAENLEMPFDKVKQVDMRLLPSWQTQKLLEKYGQDRQRRPGSNIVDNSLAALAPYVDELFVDKRTTEDFRRLNSKNEAIVPLLGKIRKAKNFNGLLSA